MTTPLPQPRWGDYTPIFIPGTAITMQAADAIDAGDPVEVAGSGAVQRATAGSPTYVGVSGHAAVLGDLVTIFAGKIVHQGPCEGDITAGMPLETSALDGRQVKEAADFDAPSVIGIALTTAPDATDVRWLQY